MNTAPVPECIIACNAWSMRINDVRFVLQFFYRSHSFDGAKLVDRVGEQVLHLSAARRDHRIILHPVLAFDSHHQPSNPPVRNVQ